MHNSSVKWDHMGNFDLEPSKHNFPTNPMGSSGTLWARPYNNNYQNQKYELNAFKIFIIFIFKAPTHN